MAASNRSTIIVDTDSDEESPPKQKYGSRSRRGRGRNTTQKKSSEHEENPSKQIRNSRSKRGRGKLPTRASSSKQFTRTSVVIDIDDSLSIEDGSNCQSDEESPAKQIFSSRSRRGRGRGKLQTRTPKSSKQFNRSSLVVDEDDSLILEDESFCATHPLPEEDLSNSVAAESNRNNSAGLLRTNEPTDAVLLTENCAPVASQSRKITKRGLAKRHCEAPPRSDSSLLPSHNISVYSHAVAEEFKSLIHGVTSLEAEVEDSGKLVTAEDKESSTEFSSINVDSTLTGSQEMFRQDNVDLDEADEELLTAIKIQSPSPPAKSFTSRVRPMNRKLTSALKALNQAKKILDKKTPPRKHQRRSNDVIIVGEDPCIQDIVVKVRYLTKVHRIQIKLNDPFHVLTKKLSKEVNEAEHNLGLYLHDRSLEVTATPQSVKLSVADIIECHCIKVSEDSVCSSDAVELVIQCRNNKSRITIIANKRRPLSDVIQKYAQLVNVDASSLVLSFDGEDVEPSDTPSKLEMEDHDVIDVVHN